MKMTRVLVVATIATLNLGCLVAGVLGLRSLLHAGLLGIVVTLSAVVGVLICGLALARSPGAHE